MKKLFFGLLALSFVSINVVFANETTPNNYQIAYISASSVRSEINSLNSQNRSYESKIRRIKYSKDLSENEKRRKISQLEYKIRYNERKIRNIKSEFRRAIS